MGSQVKQRVILYLGSSPLLEDKENRVQVLSILKSKIFDQPDLFPTDCDAQLKQLGLNLYEKYKIRYNIESESTDNQNINTQNAVSIPPLPQLADYHQVDIKGLEIAELKAFGGEFICQQILDKLQLRYCLQSCGFNDHQIDRALISIAARALYASSEYKTAQILSDNSSLKELYDYQSEINHQALYAISDKLYAHRELINGFLYQRFNDMFSFEDKILIFDISNTYFETNKSASHLAQYGRSKEKRNDCPLVVFTAVINAQGFFKHSRIYEGNKADVATLGDMLSDLEAHAQDGVKKTVVIDAGIASEDNLALIQSKGHHYVCVSRHRLKEYQTVGEQDVIELTDRGKQQVKLNIFSPDGYEDTWMQVQSDQKRTKEQSIVNKLSDRFIEDLTAIRESISKKGGVKRIEKVWERVGRVKEKHKNVSGQYEITIKEENGKATQISWVKKVQTKARTDKEQGFYFIRTNYEDPNEKQLWGIYNTIREVESTFRCLKTDLNIRPVHHQNDDRIQAHIYLAVLAYQLVNTIRHMLKAENINHHWSNIVRIMSTQTIQTIEVPTDKKNIHIRKPSRPIKEVLDIYRATNCKSIIQPVKKYVVYH